MTWSGGFRVQESQPGRIRAVADRDALSGTETGVQEMELTIKLDPNGSREIPQIGDTINPSEFLYQ